MSIEERFEAITQTLELVAGMHRDQSQTIDKILIAVKQDGENIAALARIAEAHEHRVDNLEQGS